MKGISIRRGTTPEIWFQLPMDAQRVTDATVSIHHGDSVVIEKHTADCMKDGKSIGVLLTQEETLRLSGAESAFALVHIVSDGMSMCSQKVGITVNPSLKDEVI